MMDDEPLTLRMTRIIQAIPHGKICSYGRIAAAAGSPQGSRMVARLLHSAWHTRSLPWHRVVNRDGFIALPGEGWILQKTLLEAEGVIVSEKGGISLKDYLWDPFPLAPIPRSL